MRMHMRVNTAAKLGAAYQHQEDLEMLATTSGHSLLTRGRELVSLAEFLVQEGKTGNAVIVVEFMETHGIRWASTDTKMSVANVRLHLRLLRRCSMAVVDQGNPQYPDNALFFLRKSKKCLHAARAKLNWWIVRNILTNSNVLCRTQKTFAMRPKTSSFAAFGVCPSRFVAGRPLNKRDH